MDLAAAKRSARVLSFLASRYGGLTALLASGGGRSSGPATGFATILVAIHQVLESARPSDAKTSASDALSLSRRRSCVLAFLRSFVRSGSPGLFGSGVPASIAPRRTALDGAALRVAIALGGGFLERLATTRAHGAEGHVDARLPASRLAAFGVTGRRRLDIA